MYDIAIIGSGSVGAFGGYYGAKDGKKIALIDRFHAPHSFGSYHGETRIFRIAYGEGSKYIPLLQQAYTLWGEFEQASGERLFHRGGVLNAGSASNAFMKNLLLSVEEFKLDCEVMDAKEITSRYNIHTPSHYIGVKEHNTGFIYSEKSIAHAINMAKHLGASVLYGNITRINKKNGIYEIYLSNKDDARNISNTQGDKNRAKGFYRDNTRIQAKKLLICAGSFVNDVMKCFTCDVRAVPVKAKRKIIHWYHSGSHNKLYKNLAAFILETKELASSSLDAEDLGDHFYGFSGSDEIKIGRDRSGQYITSLNERGEFLDRGDDMTELAHIKDFFPHIGAFSRGGVCSYPMSPDNDFIIDFIAEDVFFIGGLSHGFKFAPALGRYGIDMLSNKPKDSDIQTYFSLDRFIAPS